MNTSCRRVRNIAWSIFAPVFLCAAAGTLAQSVHQEVDAEGQVTYTDRPRPTPSPGAAPTPGKEVDNALARKLPLSSRHATTVDANEASRRLRQTQKEREQGVPRRPGENIVKVGTTITDERYQSRQDNLRQAVEKAQRRVNETSQAIR